MEIGVQDKYIAIIGVSSCIGRRLAKELIRNGARVIGTYFQNEVMDTEELGEAFLQTKCDITSLDDIEKLIQFIDNHKVVIDGVVNCVGIISDDRIDEMKDTDWKKVIDVNLTGSFSLIQAFSNLMKVRSKGKIICLSSVLGISGRENQGNYAASKAGLNLIAKTAAMEMGKYGVSVNIVCPGYINTNLNRSNEYKKIAAQSESYLPIDGNLGALVNFIVYMLSDLFFSVTGQTFIIDSRVQRTM